MKFIKTIGITFLIFLFLAVIYWNVGLPWKYLGERKAIEEALFKKYNQDFIWDDLSFDFFSNKTYHGYLKDKEGILFYASFATGQFEDSYASSYWRSQAKKDVNPILEKYFPNAEIKTSDLQENYPEGFFPFPNYKKAIDIHVYITDSDYLIEDMQEEIEKLWRVTNEFRALEIPVTKIWLNYTNYTSEIELNTILSKEDFQQYFVKK